jgi:hypothetical protein
MAISTDMEDHALPAEYLEILETERKLRPQWIEDNLELLETSEKREAELEALYVQGLATEAQLAELEQVRWAIEWAREGLDGMGYYNPQ